ncbi:Phosphatidate cytidylyltransferase [Moraxella catarrhalis]|nr:Phosphatidate cytidylyltransferase [Moraxella catarrhalis]
MWQRIKTAIILVLIVGFALFASSMPIFVLPLLAIGVLIAAHEWTKLMPKCRQPVQFILVSFNHHHVIGCTALDLGILVDSIAGYLGNGNGMGRTIPQ